MEKLLEIFACSTVSILVFALMIVIFFILDFIMYCLTNKCILHTVYEIFNKLVMGE